MRGDFFMDIWRIRGGNRLNGACRVQGSKNASLPILAAAILAPKESVLTNVPWLRDIDAALCILRCLGCEAEQRDDEVYINASGVTRSARVAGMRIVARTPSQSYGTLPIASIVVMRLPSVLTPSSGGMRADSP